MKTLDTLIRQFETFAAHEQYVTAFTDLLDYFLMGFKWHDSAEEQEKALGALTSHPKKEQLVALLTCIGEFSEGFADPLGAMYEQLISHGRNGQFFTPEPIADMMARLTIPADTPDGRTVCDPACGSGRMVLAAAKINRHFRFYGADVDLLCCKMSVANMLLNSLTGEISHMNTLSNAFYKGYAISTVLINGHHHPYYREFTDPQESYVWLRPIQSETKAFDTPLSPTMSPWMSQGVQGNLFNQL